ncbi:MAG: hypothetical protein HY705_01505 [Gemmatimonadetes bacterium]|nr:hypothetical protein [Gemmatimonadota bacterium]
MTELGLTPESRPLRLASRLLFRLVSRDDDSKLLFEYQKYGAAEPGMEPWVRGIIREAAAAALAQSSLGDDPRVRGAAHRIANLISQFLRSDLVRSPFQRRDRTWLLDPRAHPPTIFSVALLAHLPAVQRERAGLVERLGTYLASAAPKRQFAVACGRKLLKPTFLLFGDPLHVGASGITKDLPFGIYWMELLARLGVLQGSASAARLWTRLQKECDGAGVWHPKNLRTIPKRGTPWSYHYFPLEHESKRPEYRQADVTFRMALIARLAGWELTAT